MALGIELQGTAAKGLGEDPLGAVERLLSDRIAEARVSRPGNADCQPTLFPSRRLPSAGACFPGVATTIDRSGSPGPGAADIRA
jgi:hypothetical protein